MADRPAPPQPIFEEEVAIAAEEAPESAGGPSPVLAFAAVIIGNILLALGPWWVRLADVGPTTSGFWRLALALPFLGAIAARSHGKAPPPKLGVWLPIAGAGLFFAADLASWHAGILRTRLANATLFGNVSSFCFAAYGFIIARRLPSRRQGSALALAAIGMMLLLGRSYELSAGHLVGDLLCIFAGISYVGYMILIDRVRGRLGTWPTLAIATSAATMVLLPLATLTEGRLLPAAWAPLLGLAIGSQVLGQGLLVWTIRVLPPTLVGIGQLTQPMVAAAIGWIIFGERLTPADAVGVIAIIVALVLVRKP